MRKTLLRAPFLFNKLRIAPFATHLFSNRCKLMGGVPPSLANHQPQKHNLCVFNTLRTLLHDFAPTKKLSSIESLPCALFAKNTRGGGGTLSPNSAFYLLLSTFPRYLPTGHEPLVTDHSPGKRTVALSPHSTPLPLCGAAPAHTIEIESDAKTASSVRSLANWSRKNNLWVR